MAYQDFRTHEVTLGYCILLFMLNLGASTNTWEWWITETLVFCIVILILYFRGTGLGDICYLIAMYPRLQFVGILYCLFLSYSMLCIYGYIVYPLINKQKVAKDTRCAMLPFLTVSYYIFVLFEVL